MVYGVNMSDSNTIIHNIANFLPSESVTMTHAVQLLGVSSFEMIGNPTTQEEWNTSFINHDVNSTITFEQVYAKYLELRNGL